MNIEYETFVGKPKSQSLIVACSEDSAFLDALGSHRDDFLSHIGPLLAKDDGDQNRASICIARDTSSGEIVGIRTFNFNCELIEGGWFLVKTAARRRGVCRGMDDVVSRVASRFGLSAIHEIPVTPEGQAWFNSSDYEPNVFGIYVKEIN